MNHQLPALKYDLSALEPHFSRETLSFHYEGHHAAYVKKLNRALEDSELKELPLDDLIVKTRESRQTSIFNPAAQHWNHSFFWNCLTPSESVRPSAELSQALERDFGSMETFKQEFAKTATSIFGSGWAWLVKADEEGHLKVVTTPNGDNFVGRPEVPLLTCDMWEHAYYIDYRNDKQAYMKAYWGLVNWQHANAHFTQETK